MNDLATRCLRHNLAATVSIHKLANAQGGLSKGVELPVFSSSRP